MQNDNFNEEKKVDNATNNALEKYGMDIKPYDSDQNETGKFRIPVGKDVLAKASVLTQALPVLAANSMASDALGKTAYAITFKGKNVLPSELFKKNNGSLISNLKGDSGTFGKQADINPLDFTKEKGALVLSSAFAVAAVATSQYYMKNIDDKLKEIQATTKRIIAFLENDKQSQVEADIKILEEIAGSLDKIKSNPALERVKLDQFSSLQRDAIKNIKFYEKQIKSDLEEYLASKNDVTSGDGPLESLKKDYYYYRTCLQEYAVSKLIEIQLTDQYDKPNISKIRKEIDGMSDKYKGLSERILSDIYGYHLKSIKGKVLQGVSKTFSFASGLIEKTPIGKTEIDENLGKWGQQIGDIPTKLAKDTAGRILTKEDYGIMDKFSTEIDKIECTYNKPLELIYDDDEVFIEVETDDGK